MRKVCLLLGVLCIVAIAVMPAQAFTAKDLTVTVSQNGDAQFDMHYDLSWVEQAAVFFRIADPAGELKKGLENELNTPVTVTNVQSSSADVTIAGFATATPTTGGVVITTPSFTFAHVQEAINKYWFAQFISPNFTPQTTTIVFPDGFRATYNNLINIPSVTHKVGGV